MTLPVSLIVATYGRESELRAFLDSVAATGDKAVEIILADQNEDDRVARLLRQCPEGLNVRHLRLARPGADAARNAGAALASHSWLGFPDDDCTYLPGTLPALRAAIAESGASVVSGSTVNEAGVPNILRWRREAGGFDCWSMFRCMSESTLFIRADVFAAAGGFDPRFGPGAEFPGAEAAEMLVRIFGTGVRGWFEPKIRIYHPTRIPPWDEAAAARVWAYAFGEGGLVAKQATAPVLWRTAKFIVKHCIASLLPRSGLARCSRRKLVGLAQGYLAYRLLKKTPATETGTTCVSG